MQKWGKPRRAGVEGFRAIGFERLTSKKASRAYQPNYRKMSSYSPYCTIMNYKEHLTFLLEIGIEYRNYKNTINYICRSAVGKPVERLIEEIDAIIQTPSKELKGKDWFNVGWILASYFGEKACKMVYGKTMEEMLNYDKGNKNNSSK